MTQTIDPVVTRLSRDMRLAAATLSPKEARYLVDYYYLTQEDRKRANNQERSLEAAEEPHELVGWLGDNARLLEGQVKAALAAYSQASPVGQWAESITGIGPILSAGLLAHIDIDQAPTAGHIWRYAGLDPTDPWNKGEKRPWNARLKTLAWKIGESFNKTQNLESDFYGHLLVTRKEYEQGRNDRGELADQAAEKLRLFKIGKDTEAHKWYSQGKLPPAHIHARAKRWTVKLYLAHWHEVSYTTRYGVAPPKPFILTQPAHTHEVRVPNWPR